MEPCSTGLSRLVAFGPASSQTIKLTVVVIVVTAAPGLNTVYWPAAACAFHAWTLV